MTTSSWRSRHDVANMKAWLNLAAFLAVALAEALAESDPLAVAEGRPPGPPPPNLCGALWKLKKNGKCYQNSMPAKVAFKLAKNICKEKGGMLATPRTKEEKEIILAMNKKVKASPENKLTHLMDAKAAGYWMDATLVGGKWVAGDNKESIDPQPEIGGCEPGWVPHKGSCYKFTNKFVRWSEATLDCEGQEAKLALPTSKEMNKFLYKIAKNKIWIRVQKSSTWKDTSSTLQQELTWTDWNYYSKVQDSPGGGVMCGTLAGPAWDYQWTKTWCAGDRYKYICVKPGTKVSSKDSCRLLIPSIGWADVPCDSSHYFICEKKKAKPPKVEGTKLTTAGPKWIKICDQGWKLRLDFCYQHFKTKVWQRDAVAQCKNRDAFLFLPLNKDENNFVHKMSRSRFNQWIAATRRGPGSPWVNSNNEPLQWTHWHAQVFTLNCAYMRARSQSDQGGKWEIMRCRDGPKFGFTCKKAAIKKKITPPPTTTTTTKAPEKKAVWKIQFYATCYPACDATLYRGTVRKTESGLDCQMWSEQEPHKHGYANSWYDFVDVTLPNNYCRDTKYGYKGKPWCFTTDPTKQWEFCTVPKCEFTRCFPACDGSLYRGDVSETVSGAKCQDWQHQEPHKHMVGMDEADFVDGELPSNLCRTLESHVEHMEGGEGAVQSGRSEVPWCFTTDVVTVRERCRVPDCAGLLVDDPSWDKALGSQAAGADHVAPVTSLVTWLCVLCALPVCWNTWQ